MQHYLGIDLGGTNLVAGVVDEKYNIVAKHSVPTNAGQGFERLVADMAAVAKRAAEKAGIPLEAFTSLGVGTPSTINPKTRLLVHANNLGWRNVPLYTELEKHFALPVFIQNDANCAALGEMLAGAGRGLKNSVMLTLGTGCGGGVIYDNKIFTGGDNMGAELGHTVFTYGGIPCNCGRVGCLENYASATALKRQTAEALDENPSSLMMDMIGGDFTQISGRTAFDAAKRGDKTALKVVEQYISYVAGGCATFIAVFRPDVVIIGGGISGEGEYLLEPLNRKIFEYTYASEECGVPPAVKAVLGNDAGIIGAALLEHYTRAL